MLEYTLLVSSKLVINNRTAIIVCVYVCMHMYVEGFDNETDTPGWPLPVPT